MEWITGRIVPLEKNPFISFSNYSGLPARILLHMESFAKIFTPVRNNMEDVSLVWGMNRFLERASRGFENPKRMKSFNNDETFIDVSKPRELLDSIEQRVGQTEFIKLQKAADRASEFFQTVQMPRVFEAELITDAGLKGLLQKNPKFAPLDVLEYFDVNAGNIAAIGKTLDTSPKSILKTMRGTTKDIDNVLIAAIRRIPRIEASAFRNLVVKDLIGLRDLGPEARSYIIKLRGDQNATQFGRGFSEINYTSKGVTSRYAVPTPVADTVGRLNKETLSFIDKMVGATGAAFRATVTTWSPGFTVANFFRDLLMVSVRAKQFGITYNPQTYIRGLFNAINRGPLFEEYMKQGAGFATFHSRAGAGILGRAEKKQLMQLSKSEPQKFIETILNPFDLMRAVGEVVELAPRLAIFEQARRQGMPNNMATYFSRNSSIDFGKMGTKGRVLNMWIPFLNAKVQGTLNTFEAVRNKPGGVAQVVLPLVVAPVIATYLWNVLRFPHVLKDISDFERDRNFILILGDEMDDEGRYTQVKKIPKGDIGRMFGNPIEAALDFAYGKDPGAIDDLALKLLADLSPLDFETDGKFDAMRLWGEVTPPFFEAGMITAGAFETNPFTGRRVVPRGVEARIPAFQFKPDVTSVTVKELAQSDLGRAMNLSPIRVEEGLRVGTGAAGRGVIDFLDRMRGQTKGKIPFLTDLSRRFSGAFGGAIERRHFNRLRILTEEFKTRNFLLKQKVELTLTASINGDKRAGLTLARMSVDPVTKDIVRDSMRQRRLGLSAFERFLKISPLEARAQWILETTLSLPPGERINFLLEMREKTILTEAAWDEVVLRASKQGKRGLPINVTEGVR